MTKRDAEKMLKTIAELREENKLLRHYHDTTVGMFVTDRPDLVDDSVHRVLIELTPLEFTQEKKTSKEFMELDKYKNKVIMDPDGWDRQNYDFSFNIEKITEEEFQHRLAFSTIMQRSTNET